MTSITNGCIACGMPCAAGSRYCASCQKCAIEERPRVVPMAVPTPLSEEYVASVEGRMVRLQDELAAARDERAAMRREISALKTALAAALERLDAPRGAVDSWRPPTA